MIDISSVEIPMPLNWQDFQRCCVPLFRKFIQDPQLQEWGRDGQTQNGIDLFGFRDRDHKRPVGIQCKRYKNPISEKLIRETVSEAKKMQPCLTELIFACTSERDAKIQSVAAKITLELHESGWPCRVIVMGWQDLRLEISKYSDALDAFLPSVQAHAPQIVHILREADATTQSKLDLLRDMVEGLSKSQTVFREEYDAELEPEAQSEPAGIHAEITTYRNLIRKGQTKIALEELTRLLARALPLYARYRVLSNVSGIHLNAGRYAAALDFSRQAHALRPNDVKARTNLAFAELVNGDFDGAARRAETILANNPSHGSAASALVQARLMDKTVSDPFAIVPVASHETVDFKVAAIVFLRQRHDASWAKLAAEAFAKHPDNGFLMRFAAEAELEPILNDPDTMLGKRVGSEVIVTIKRCAETLQAIWTKDIAVDEVRSDDITSLATNLASVYRYAGDHMASGDVLDQTIAKVGRVPILLRARALLYLHSDDDQKAVALLAEGSDDPEARLFVAQVLTTKQPIRALTHLEGLDPNFLPEHLRSVVFEVRAEIAIVQKDPEMLRSAIEKHKALGGSFATSALLEARGRELGLLEIMKPNPIAIPTELAVDDEFDDLSEIVPIPSHVNDLIEGVTKHEASLSFVDRLQIAQYLDNHDVFEVASNLLFGLVQLDRDTVGLRTYLSSSIGAQLTARAQAALDAIPADVAAKPYFQRMAATHYWNSGDPKSAAPLIEAMYQASPTKLYLFLWYIDSLLREGRQDKIRELLQPPVEDALEGTVALKSRLARALANFGQPKRALKLAYRGFILNRSTPAAWMGLMSVMLASEDFEGVPLLSEVIGPDHSFEVLFADGSKRRFVIESDEAVRNVEHEALPPDHGIAKAVQGLKSGDNIRWPLGGGEATIISAKHKYLDAAHSAMIRYNERFPDAKGFKQITVKTEGEDAFAELKAEVIARSEYVIEQSKQYAGGKFSLPMLAHMTGVDPIDTMLGLCDAGMPYRVSTGLDQERLAAFTAIHANKAAGCVVDAATYYCIRRLQVEDAVVAVCGKIGITQATVDLYQRRLQNFVFGKTGGGSIGHRDGKFYLIESTHEQRDKTRAIIVSDIEWLAKNADVVPARPVEDPPPVFRRLGSVKGAHFFDEVYAANGSGRIMLVDDLFTRQVAGLLGMQTTSLQPVLMNGRGRGSLSLEQYAKAITDLAGIGQQYISVDPATLLAARKLDRDNGEAVIGRRFKTASAMLGGRSADPVSHISVVAAYLDNLWASHDMQVSDFQITSHVLRELVKDRTDDLQVLLDALDRRLARRGSFRAYLRQWAKGHFLLWPKT